MIPKIIHYCWLSGDPLPPKTLRCVNSWKRLLPDYEFICWDMKRFDIHSVKFVEEACAKRKWAFAADYIRLYAIYTCGGIYLDSDVMLYKRLDPFLDNHSFASIESYFYQWGKTNDYNIDAAMIGAEKGNPFIKACLDYYANRHFILPSGTLDQSIICHIMAKIAEERFGFVRGCFKKEPLYLCDKVMTLYPPYVFTHAKGDTRRETVAIHLMDGSWKNEKNSFNQRAINKTDALMVYLTNEKSWGMVRSSARRILYAAKHLFGKRSHL